MMSVQNGISGRGQADMGARHVEGGAVGEGALSTSDLAARSAAPPEVLRRVVLRANEDERRAISHQVAWLAHVFALESGAGVRHPCDERLKAQADASQGELSFDKGALKQAWRTRFSHLLEGARVRDVARDLTKWCAASGGQSPGAAQWHWLSSADEAASDVRACARLPMREWPVSVLSVALTLSNLRNAVLPDLSMPNGDLRGVMAPGAQFCGGHFSGAWWTGASLPNSVFALSNQVNADFERADLRGACFRAADVSLARLVGADLRCATFLHTVMCATDLSEARCQGLMFTRVRLDGASFQRAKLHGACFAGGSAHGLKLIGAKAKRSQWTSVAMHNVQALGADLRGAEFRQCELRGWNAGGVKLNGAFFEACDLRNAHFCGASLKQVRIGADCNLAGTQWQDARVRLDAAWLRNLTPPELDRVVQSWATFPLDQPAVRAGVFMQLLVALGRPAGLMCMGGEVAPPLQRLPEHVQRSDWLGRLLAAGSEAGGVGEYDGFAELRAQWLKHTLHTLADERLPRTRAAWGMESLMTTLHRHCSDDLPEAVWPFAGAMCQTLYWAAEGVGGVGALRAQALRAAWFDALPPQACVALSADGVDAYDSAYVVLIRSDGDVAARLPRHLLAGVLGARSGAPATADDVSLAGNTIPGWQWLGTRVVVRDGVSSDDFVPGTMSQLQGLLREFGFLAELWPVERPLDTFVRLVGRWFGKAGAQHANAACHGTWDPLHGAVGAGDTNDAHASLSAADRFGALVSGSRSPGQVQLRRDGHADIEDVFRDAPLVAPAGEAGLSFAMSRRVRLVSVAAGLSWLATQPAWHRAWPTAHDDASAPTGAAPSAAGIGDYRGYALATLNEAMRGDVAWRKLPQALALRTCLADEICPAGQLAQRLVDWLTCPEIRHLPGLAQACRQTLPWFWAIRLPLEPDAVRQGMDRWRGDADAVSAGTQGD